MDNFKVEEVDVLVIDADASSRQMVRNILTDNGFRRVRVGHNMADLRDQLMLGWPDLLISQHEVPGGNFSNFVFKLRHHELGGNPFMPIISTVWSPTQEDVRSIIQSGADDLVTMPLSAGQLLNRIKALIVHRKPFVVTSAYIGPDRRKLEDRTSEIPQVVVPNMLKAKASGDVVDPGLFQRQVDETIGSINLQKIERHAVQVKFLVDRIAPTLDFGPPDDVTTRSLQRLLFVAEDISRRMIGTKYAHVSSLCKSIITVTNDILAAGDMPMDKDVKLLKQMSKAITAGFANIDSETTAAAAAISKTVTH